MLYRLVKFGFLVLLVLLLVLESRTGPPAGEVKDMPTGYKNLVEFTNEMFRISSMYPSSIRLLDLTSIYGENVLTHEGRSIFGLRISSSDDVKYHKPKVLLISGQHGNEVLPPEVLLRLAEMFGIASKESSESDSPLKEILSKFELYFIPLLNVDGYNHAFEKLSTWRKNRRPTVENEIGIDINRNYDVGWDFIISKDIEKENMTECLSDGDIQEMIDPSSRVFRGGYAFSETETIIMKNMMEDLRFAKLLDVHSYGQFVYFGVKDCFPLSTPKLNIIRSMAENIASAANYSTYVPWDFFYSFAGDLMMYHYQKYSDCSFTVETALKFQPEYEYAEKHEIPNILNLLIKFLDLEIPIIGQLNQYGIPLGNIEYSVQKIPNVNGERRRTTSDGYFYLFVPKGTYTIQFFLEEDVNDDDDEDKNNIFEVSYDGMNSEVINLDICWINLEFYYRVREASDFVKIISIVSMTGFLLIFCCVFYRCFCHCCCIEKLPVDPRIIRDLDYPSSSDSSSDYSNSSESSRNSSWSEHIDFVSDFDV